MWTVEGLLDKELCQDATYWNGEHRQIQEDFLLRRHDTMFKKASKEELLEAIKFADGVLEYVVNAKNILNRQFPDKVRTKNK